MVYNADPITNKDKEVFITLLDVIITLLVESSDSFLASVFITLLDVIITLLVESSDSFLASVFLKKV